MKSPWRSSVVRVFVGDPDGASQPKFLGSAFLIGAKSLLTCSHVVGDADSLQLFVSGPAWTGPHRVTATKLCPERDVAVLEVASDFDRIAPPLIACTSLPGRSLDGLALTLAGYTSPTSGLETPPMPLRSYDGQRDTLVLHTHLSKGFSGGPALANGCVAGIVHARELEGAKTYVIPITAIKAFLLNTGAWVEFAGLHSVREAAEPEDLESRVLRAPAKFVGRTFLTAKLISDLQSAEGSEIFALYGLPGVGKSSLAAYLAHCQSIRDSFDGLVYATGVGPNRLKDGLLLSWARQVSLDAYKEAADAPDLDDRKEIIVRAIGARRALFIADSLWTEGDVLAHTLGGRCVHLFTMRAPDLGPVRA